jgi:hypothetical protein
MLLERVVPGMGRITFEDRDNGFRRYQWEEEFDTNDELQARELSRPVRMPSVTTLLGRIFSSDALVQWAEEQGIRGTHLFDLEVGRIADHTTDDIVGMVRRAGYGANAKREQGANRGSVVHDVLERYARTGESPRLADHDPEHRGYVQGLTRWILAADPRPIHVERLTCHPGLGYAGRLDLVCEIDRQRCLVDLKTSARGMVQDKAVTQECMYAEAEVALGDPYPDRMLIVAADEHGGFAEVDCSLTDESIRDMAEAAARWHTVQGLARSVAGKHYRKVRKQEAQA